MEFLFLVSLCILLSQVDSVDRNNFKTCDQSSFCKRHRLLEPGQSSFELQMNSIEIHPTYLAAILLNTERDELLKFELHALVHDTFRLRINEVNPLYPRFEPKESLAGEPEHQIMTVTNRAQNSLTVTAGNNHILLTAKPLRLDLFSHNELVISANLRGLLKFEKYRLKKVADSDDNTELKHIAEENEQGMWEENFKGHADSKPLGPSSVGMDFSFIGFDNMYGLAEHADHLSLRNTRNIDPYRLYNLDVFEYELDNNMAIYASIPYLIAQSTTNTVGMLWLNAAETWVDIESLSEQQNMMSNIVDYVKGQVQPQQTDTHWFSESGIIDVFFMLGPSPQDVFKQYSRLTGVTELPPLFSLGYHQCRWNYNDEEDVRNVDASFDEYDIPYDVLWLDIEYTDGKRYFTWDKSKFPHPEEMINNLTAKGRKMVTIIDPHIKRAHGYFVHEEATSRGYYVKNKDGGDYEGWCWPGSSSWLDFFNPDVREYWMSKLSLKEYEGSTLSLFVWNDMNEPSVFNGPEITMHKDAKHFGNWEHRDVHNLYGLLLQMSTYEGLIRRSNGKHRPFLLTRAAFAGSQRYGALWTGDNTAEWSHLQYSLPMILSLGLCGISFAGADVGGFFKTPETELLVRWYQAAAFQPFFRAHSHIDTRRREPWLFDENTRLLIRDAIRRRYAFLPYIYTLFYEHEKTAVPVMRPLWVEFPREPKTFKVENEYMLGNAMLVHPVTVAGATKAQVFFPGEHEVWYDAELFDKYDSTGYVSIPVSLSKVPIYQRGGTIIPKRSRIRRASSLGYEDPYSLVVALDKSGLHANGTIYMDDNYSFEYKTGQFIFLSVAYTDGILKSRNMNINRSYKSQAWLERVTVLGLRSRPTNVQIENKASGRKKLEYVYIDDKQVLVIRKPSVKMEDEWVLTIQ